MEQRKFSGIWIDKEIWLDTRLNAIEKIILMEIDSLDATEEGCYAGNDYLAEFCQCSETKISTAISKLINLGYLELKGFDGRRRYLKSRLSKIKRQPLKNSKADTKKLKENNIDNNINDNNIYSALQSNKKITRFVPPSKEEITEYARTRNRVDLVDKFYDYFTTGNWVDSKGNKVRNWKQKFITWEKFQENSKLSHNFEARNYTESEMNDLFDNLDEVKI